MWYVLIMYDDAFNLRKTTTTAVLTRGGNTLAQQQNILAHNNELLNSAMMNIEKAFEKTCQLKSTIATSQVRTLLLST